MITKTSKLAAIIPMKPLEFTKTRLGGLFDSSQRTALSLGMLKVVVDAVSNSKIGKVWIVGGDNAIKQIAAELNSEWYEDAGRDLNDSLAQSFRLALDSGLIPMYLPADLPFLKPADLEGLVRASHQGQKLTLSPANRDGGTNAIIVPSNSSFSPILGLDSFKRHSRQAEELNLPMGTYNSLGLGLDLDTVEDLKVYEEMEPDLLNRLTEGVDLFPWN